MAISAADLKPNTVYHRASRISNELPRLLLFLPRTPGDDGLLETINLEEAEVLAEVSGGELRYIVGPINVEKYPLEEPSAGVAASFIARTRRQLASALGSRRS